VIVWVAGARANGAAALKETVLVENETVADPDPCVDPVEELPQPARIPQIMTTRKIENSVLVRNGP
jgi:hypothetical protein